MAVFVNLIHLLKVFEVILAFIRAIGMLFSFALKIKFGQISESTKKIAFGFHRCKNLLIKNSISRGKNLWWILSNFRISFSAKLPELKVTVVIKNSKFLFLFNSFTIGNILWNSPMLAAWNQINFVFFFLIILKWEGKIFSLYLVFCSFF